MPSKIYNKKTGKLALEAGQDAIGNYLMFENGIKMYALITAVTPNVTTTTAAAGSIATTSHATGRGSVFMSDGSKWQLQPDAA